MKTIKKYAALFCALCTILAVSGCDNNLLKPTLPEGQGAIVLSIGGSASRTIAPSNVGAIDKYVVGIYLHGGDLVEERELVGFESGLFFLRDGAYDIFVEGLVGNNVVAEGEQLNVAVAHGTTIEVNIELVPALSGGNGTFAWNLTFDANITAAMMKIGSRESINVFENKNADETLPSGEYNVVFTLSYGTATVEWTERLHVYRYLTSTFVHTFEDLRLETLADRIQALIVAKTFAGITEQHFELLGVAGVTNGNLSDVLGAIEWVSDLKSSVDIALIDIHNFNNAYNDIADLKNAIIAVVKNTTITAGDITVSGTETLTATLTIGGKTVTITGFTINSAAITSIVLGLTNVQQNYFQFYSTALNYANLVVTAKHEVGEDGTVDSNDYTITTTPSIIAFDTAQTIKVTVTLTANSAITADYDIVILPLESISIVHTAVTKDYYQYIPATVNLTNLVVTGHWKDAEEKDHPHTIDDYTPTGATLDVNTADDQTITITYHEKPATFDVTVHELVSIKVTGSEAYAEAPTSANIKTAISNNIILVTGTYEDTTPHVLNAYVNDADVTVTPVPGQGQEYTVTLTWNNITCSEFKFTYNDTTQVLQSLSVSGNFGKYYQYFSGWGLAEGLIVTTNWSNDESRAKSTEVGNIAADAQYNSDDFNNQIPGDYTIYVTYNGEHGTANGSYDVTVIPFGEIVLNGDIHDSGKFNNLPSVPDRNFVMDLIDSIQASYENGEHFEWILRSDLEVEISSVEDGGSITISWKGHAYSTTFIYTLKNSGDDDI